MRICGIVLLSPFTITSVSVMRELKAQGSANVVFNKFVCLNTLNSALTKSSKYGSSHTICNAQVCAYDERSESSNAVTLPMVLRFLLFNRMRTVTSSASNIRCAFVISLWIPPLFFISAVIVMVRALRATDKTC